jgi:hypothetical protein
MVTLSVTGNIYREATAPFGNIFDEAMRQRLNESLTKSKTHERLLAKTARPLFVRRGPISRFRCSTSTLT